MFSVLGKVFGMHANYIIAEVMYREGEDEDEGEEEEEDKVRINYYL